jgi:HSP20 family protein
MTMSPFFDRPFGFGSMLPMMRDFDRLSRAMDQQFRGLSEEFDWTPKVDMTEEKDNYLILAELPGVPKDKIKVDLEEDVLTISGEKRVENEQKDEQGRVYRKERSYGSFSRSFALPDNVNAKKIKANYDHGVLKIAIPKSEESEEKFEIKVE